MPKDYFYRCSNCSKEIPSEEVESNLIYLCPDCGKANKNEPLQGVLEIIYDYDKLSRSLSRTGFIKREAGDIRSYIELLPLEYNKASNEIKSLSQDEIKRLQLPHNSLIKYSLINQEIFFLDETKNPTFSFKDRASIPVAIKARQLGINEISAASTGNAGSSIAGICSMLGMKSKIFVPKNIPEAKRIQIHAFGAELFVVDGDYDEAFDLCLELSKTKHWFNRNTAYNPITIDGKKTAAFDIFIQMKGKIPDIIFVPVGDGVIISGMYKGFWELLKLGFIEKLPKLIAVQAEGSSAVVEFIKNNKFAYKPANTIADSISAGAPRNLFMAAKAVNESFGDAIKVSDDEIVLAQSELARKGFLVEPSCAAAFVGYKNYRSKINDDELVLILLTGSGMKDFESLKKWNPEPLVQSSEEIKKLLLNEK